MNTKLSLLVLAGISVRRRLYVSVVAAHGTRGQANVLQRAELGTVTSVREVNIEGQKGQLGMYGGGLMAAAAASGGRGVGGAVVQATGAVVGAVAGQAVEEVATRKAAQEINIRLDDGSTVTVTQEVSTGLSWTAIACG